MPTLKRKIEQSHSASSRPLLLAMPICLSNPTLQFPAPGTERSTTAGMPRTALQHLNIAARYGKWPDTYSPPNTSSPGKTTTKKARKSTCSQALTSNPLPSPTKTCRLRIRKQAGKANKGKCLLVFKRYETSRVKNRQNPPCGSTRLVGKRRGSRTDIQGCKVCGLFNDLWVSDLETQIPSLRCEPTSDESSSEGYSTTSSEGSSTYSSDGYSTSCSESYITPRLGSCSANVSN